MDGGRVTAEEGRRKKEAVTALRRGIFWPDGLWRCPIGGVVFAGMSGKTRCYGPEGLRVYELALSFAAKMDDLLAVARCSASLRDQLERAAESAVLNIAEGAGHVSPGRKAYHYQLAHGSFAECSGGLPLLQRRNPNLNLEIRSARRTSDMACKMLTPLIRRYQGE